MTDSPRRPRRALTNVGERLRRSARRRGRGPLIPDWLARVGLGAWALVGIGIVVIAVVYATAQIGAVFVAVFIALVFTSILNPLVDFFGRWVNRWIAVVAALLASLIVFGGLITFVVTSVTSQWTDLAASFGNGVEMIVGFLRSLPWHITLTSDEVYQWISDLVDQGQTYITHNWSSLARGVLSNIGSVGTVATVVFLSIFITVFLLHSGVGMWRWCLNVLPQRARATTHRAAAAGWSTFSGYARGTVLVAGVDGILAGVYLTILRVPLSPALGVLVFIGAFIPLVGAPTAMVVAMIVALAANGVWSAVLVGIGIALIGQLEGHVLEPLIMSRQVSLHPLVVGVGVAAGTFLGGLFGAIIAIPLIAVVWAVFSELYVRDPPIRGPLSALGGEEEPDEAPEPEVPPATRRPRARR